MKRQSKPSRVGRINKPDPKTPASFQPASLAFNPEVVAESLDLWRLEGTKGSHVRRAQNGEFMLLSADDFNRLLRRQGIRLKAMEGEVLSDADHLKDYLQESRRVEFTMENLAGFTAGVYQMSGAVMMVKKSPKRISAAVGNCDLILRLIERMLPAENGYSQSILFHAWMKHSIDQS